MARWQKVCREIQAGTTTRVSVARENLDFSCKIMMNHLPTPMYATIIETTIELQARSFVSPKGDRNRNIRWSLERWKDVRIGHNKVTKIKIKSLLSRVVFVGV